jgi:phage shock protein A
LELPDADDKFKTELNTALTPIQAASSNFDRARRDIESDITRISSHCDTLQSDVDKLLSQAETKLKALFDQLLAKLKQCKDTAKLTFSKLHSEHTNKLKTSLADTQTRARNIQQHKTTVEQHLASTSNCDNVQFIIFMHVLEYLGLHVIVDLPVLNELSITQHLAMRRHGPT